MGDFAASNIGKDDLVGEYYGTLVYTDICRESQTIKTYGEGRMGVMVAEFLEMGFRGLEASSTWY